VSGIYFIPLIFYTRQKNKFNIFAGINYSDDMQLPLKHPIFKILSGIAAEKGIEAYVIGGYVRDLLLQRPSQDIDIVVHGSVSS
jgi:hypothetical protein